MTSLYEIPTSDTRTFWNCDTASFEIQTEDTGTHPNRASTLPGSWLCYPSFFELAMETVRSV